MNDTATNNLKYIYGKDWSRKDIEHDLPRIRKLKAIEDAQIKGGTLVIRTRAWTLKHEYALLPLRRMDIRISSTSSSAAQLGMRYVMPLGLTHPSLRRIPWIGYRLPCIGDYRRELDSAHRSPFEYVVAVLGMLQTIKKSR